MSTLPREIEDAAEEAGRYPERDQEFDFSNDLETFLSGVRWLYAYLQANPINCTCATTATTCGVHGIPYPPEPEEAT